MDRAKYEPKLAAMAMYLGGNRDEDTAYCETMGLQHNFETSGY
jgi:hypothetical protein